MQALALTHVTCISALGIGRTTMHEALRNRRPGLRPNDFTDDPLPTWIGRIAEVEAARIEGDLRQFDCRNNRVALMALRADDFTSAIAGARERYGAGRIGVFVGTSTSGIYETELAYRKYRGAADPPPDATRIRFQQNIFSPAHFVREVLELEGPALAVSTACSSSAKAFAHAWRYVASGLCDAAVVGGVDSLCYTTLYGFNSLQLLSPAPCQPCDVERSGISIGEAAGFVLLERATGTENTLLLGCGESSDAHHMSSPEPEGVGAFTAMNAALRHAQLDPSDIDYVVMHGTATTLNDQVEDLAVHRLLGDQVPVASVKGWVGHTLGAAGVTNVLAAECALSEQFLPGTLNTTCIDPRFRSNVLLGNRGGRVERVLVNAFGFGGSNCSLVIGAPQ